MYAKASVVKNCGDWSDRKKKVTYPDHKQISGQSIEEKIDREYKKGVHPLSPFPSLDLQGRFQGRFIFFLSRFPYHCSFICTYLHALFRYLHHFPQDICFVWILWWNFYTLLIFNWEIRYRLSSIFILLIVSSQFLFLLFLTTLVRKHLFLTLRNIEIFD